MIHAALLLACLAQAPAQETKPYTPQISPASDEGKQAMAAFKLPPGFVVEQWAAEPMLANPVAIYPADTGEVYVAESFRLHKGVTDIREHMDWLDDDNASRSVEDEVAMFKKHLSPEGWAAILTERERVRVIRDTNGDGIADKASVFDDRFGDPADGIGAGVLKWGRDVYFTCMPHLWRLRDENGDDQADVHESLAYGFGLHVQFLGHDLHGLAVGPDGYLYYSCGDRGFNVKTPNGDLVSIDCGAVLRCELDGSNLEIYHTGLRNPQELAFDAHGNLFTGDNNGDGGDLAKWIQIVRGGDSGWRNGWQWVNEPTPRGFFNEDKLWSPHYDGQPAYLLPPVADIGDGPSGLTYNPGTGMPPEYDGHFFLCDFRGEASYSLIWDISMKEQGAGFELIEKKPFLKNTLVTDCDFGPDGALYFSDWVSGWGQTGKGRIYRAFDPQLAQTKDVLEVKTLLHEGLSKRSESELERLLAHKDMRIRLRAELELAKRGSKGFGALRHAAQSGPSLLARLHGVWGMGAAARWDKSLDARALVPFLSDKEPEVRAQAARMVGKAGEGELVKLLGDPNGRVALRAASALGEIGSRQAATALIELAARAGEKDPTLRSAAAWSLSRCASEAELAADADPAHRMGTLLALRLQTSPKLAQFLPDAEAVRAIYDVPIPEALPALASLITLEKLPAQQITRRITYANYRLGSRENALALAKFALRPDADEYSRTEALRLLAKWQQPHGRDGLLGLWRKLPARDDSFLPVIVESLAQEQVAYAPEPVARAWVELAGQYKLASVSGLVRDLALDPKQPEKLRVASLRALDAIAPADFPATLKLALGDSLDAVRAAALPILLRVAPNEALPFLAAGAHGNRDERRAAYAALATHPNPEAGKILASELDRYLAGLVPGEVALELVEACEKRAGIEARLEQLRAPRAADALVAPYLDGVLGGDAERGRAIFKEKAAVSCLRCHRISQEGVENPEGGQVGPNLTGVGKRLTRLEIIESIVDPNRKIANGFQNTIVFPKEGAPIEGVVFEENDSELKLRDKDDKVQIIAKSDIETTKTGLSAMPTDLVKNLSREELRDLVEFLSRQ
ncbi:MAG: HEAT repeat domain-containing protein [Planctomycetes bacterium]|nr:HEAT repeat domain-containing protein [Planctomycetota bacterium]